MTSRHPGNITKTLSALPRRRGRDQCLIVAPQPAQLNAILTAPGAIRGYERTAAWVIDSFWDDRIPRVARNRGHFDHLFITDSELKDTWQRTTRTPTSWLPFGTDTLAMKPRRNRPVDLQRVGRQPVAFNDDAEVGAAASALGLVFRGRVPRADTAAGNQRALWNAMARAKFTLAFNNVVSPEENTHPTRHYLTARWTDALANGATVAGMMPAAPRYAPCCGPRPPSSSTTSGCVMGSSASARRSMPGRLNEPRLTDDSLPSAWIGAGASPRSPTSSNEGVRR